MCSDLWSSGQYKACICLNQWQRQTILAINRSQRMELSGDNKSALKCVAWSPSPEALTVKGRAQQWQLPWTEQLEFFVTMTHLTVIVASVLESAEESVRSVRR